MRGRLHVTAALALAWLFVVAQAFAADAVVTPERLLEIVDLSGVSISPDGRSVAFRTERASLEQDAHLAEWHVIDLAALGRPRRIGDGGSPLRSSAGFVMPESPQWSADSEWIYYRALIDGGIQVWRAARSGTGAQQVTHDAANVRRFRLRPESGTLVYEVGATRDQVLSAEMAEYDGGILFDRTTPGHQPLFRAMPLEGRLASLRTAQGVGLLSDAPRALRSVDLRDLRSEEADAVSIAWFGREHAAHGVPGARAHACSPGGRAIASLTGDYPASRIVVTDADGGSARECLPCADRVIEAMAWRDDETLVLTTRDPARDYAFDLQTWRVGETRLRKLTSSPGVLGGDRYGQGAACAVSARYAACVAASADVAPRLLAIDLDSGRETALFDPNRPLTRLGRATHALEFLQWRSADGKAFTGYLLLPARRAASERLPLFVTYFRCPGYLRGGYGDEWPLPSLAGHGIATLCITRPLLPSTWTQQAADDYADALAGIEAAVKLLHARGIVDRRRVGMGGMSYGAEVVAWVARNSSLLVAASLANHQVSPAWYWAGALLDGRVETVRSRWGLGAPDETPQQWALLSPAAAVDRIETPLLMQIPESEFRSNLEFHVRMVRAGKPSELWVFPEETHVKQRPRVKLAAYRRNLDWFRFWLQGWSDPDPSKAEQYRRWQDMRARQCARPARLQSLWYCG